MKFFVLLLVSLSSAAISILATPEDDLRQGNLAFAGKLYKELLKIEPSSDFVFSPFPVQTILAALASAASTDNEIAVKEIRNAVGLPQTNAQTEQAFQSILSELNESDDDFKIFDAFKMYFANGYSVKQWYRDLVLRAYHAEIETVNFGQIDVTAQKINSWVSQKTDGGIDNFLPANLLTPRLFNSRVRNILVNALYLKGKWVKPFSKTVTAKGTFYGPQRNWTVDMMTNDASYEYREDTKAQYLRMDLLKSKGNAYVEFILPLMGKGLRPEPPNVPFSISPQPYPIAKVNVTLPKFSINTDGELKYVLIDIGAGHIFTDGLRLKGLRYPGLSNVPIAEVYQKYIIPVSEWGISANSVAAPPIIVDEPQDRREFVADHPFAFQIVVDNIVAFVGHVADPLLFD